MTSLAPGSLADGSALTNAGAMVATFVAEIGDFIEHMVQGTHDMASGFVEAVLTPRSKKMLDHLNNPAPVKSQAAHKNASPAMKPAARAGFSAPMSKGTQVGFGAKQAQSFGAAPGFSRMGGPRRANHNSLRAAVPPAPKSVNISAAPKKIPVANLQVRPEALVMGQPHASQQSLEARMKYWAQGTMGMVPGLSPHACA